MYPPPSQSTLNPRNFYGPPNVGWSQLIDYQGGASPIYIWWIPTAVGTAAGLGYGQKLTYAGAAVTKVEWAVCGAGGSGNQADPSAPYANRLALNYQ